MCRRAKSPDLQMRLDDRFLILPYSGSVVKTKNQNILSEPTRQPDYNCSLMDAD